MVTETAESRLAILFVEDNEDDVEIVRRVLARSHVDPKLRVVQDGDEAVELLSSECAPEEASLERQVWQPDLVLLDLSLPRVSGVEILRRMKADADLRSVPVVVLTGDVADEQIQECLELGANMYLFKPMNVADVANITFGLRNYWAGVDDAGGRAA